MKIKIPMLMLALLGVLTLTACETVEGAGRDIEHAGQSVQGSAQ